VAHRARHINILVPSLTRGGAERAVLDILLGLRDTGVTAKLFLLHDTSLGYQPPKMDHVDVVQLGGQEDFRKLRAVALEVLASPSPIVYTHLVGASYLRCLWDLGVRTIPVIQNAQPSWQNPPGDFDHPCVPLVVSVSEAVADQLREAGCPARVMTIRHELQRWFTPEELSRNREAIRRRYGIPDSAVLIGMVGQFKAQKAYTRAVSRAARASTDLYR